MKLKGPIVKKPLGPQEHGYNLLLILGTTNSIKCQVCGKTHSKPKKGSNHAYADFLGLQVVMSCCGKLFDILYKEYGIIFATTLLDEYKDNPDSPELNELKKALKYPLLIRRK